MGKFGFPIQVSRKGLRGAESAIRVDYPLDEFGLPGMRLMASGNKAPLVESKYLPEGLGWSIDDRLRNQGALKGRVLAVWQDQQLVGACAWHLHESGPPVIFDLGCRIDLEEAVALRIKAVFLGCLRDVAEHQAIRRTSDALRWADLPTKRIHQKAERSAIRGAIRRRAKELGFDKPPKPRPKWLKNKWAAERRFK